MIKKQILMAVIAAFVSSSVMPATTARVASRMRPAISDSKTLSAKTMLGAQTKYLRQLGYSQSKVLVEVKKQRDNYDELAGLLNNPEHRAIRRQFVSSFEPFFNPRKIGNVHDLKSRVIAFDGMVPTIQFGSERLEDLITSFVSYWADGLLRPVHSRLKRGLIWGGSLTATALLLYLTYQHGSDALMRMMSNSIRNKIDRDAQNVRRLAQHTREHVGTQVKTGISRLSLEIDRLEGVTELDGELVRKVVGERATLMVPNLTRKKLEQNLTKGRK